MAPRPRGSPECRAGEEAGVAGPGLPRGHGVLSWRGGVGQVVSGFPPVSGGDPWGLPLWSRQGSRAPCGPGAQGPASPVWGSRLACGRLWVPSECPAGATSVCSSVEERAWASQVALVVKNPPASAGDTRDAGSIPGSGRSPGGGPGHPLQCSCPENPMDRGAWGP